MASPAPTARGTLASLLPSLPQPPHPPNTPSPPTPPPLHPPRPLPPHSTLSARAQSRQSPSRAPLSAARTPLPPSPLPLPRHTPPHCRLATPHLHKSALCAEDGASCGDVLATGGVRGMCVGAVGEEEVGGKGAEDAATARRACLALRPAGSCAGRRLMKAAEREKAVRSFLTLAARAGSRLSRA
jgi:hypothetical protein